MVRRALLALLAVLVLGLLGLLGAVGSAFVGVVPVEDGRTYADGRIVTVADGYVACFLVDTGAGWLLVDACADPGAEAIRRALAARGAALSDVALVLLTHGHSDHVGGLAALPGVPVGALEEELPYLAGQAAFRGPLPGAVGAVDTGVRVSQPLRDGAHVALGDVEVVTFAVPGHTAGSAAYLIGDTLLVGDNATATRHGLVGAPWVFSDDTAGNVASLRALGARLAASGADVRWLVPAHSAPAEGLEPLLTL